MEIPPWSIHGDKHPKRKRSRKKSEVPGVPNVGVWELEGSNSSLMHHAQPKENGDSTSLGKQNALNGVRESIPSVPGARPVRIPSPSPPPRSPQHRPPETTELKDPVQVLRTSENARCGELGTLEPLVPLENVSFVRALQTTPNVGKVQKENGHKKEHSHLPASPSGAIRFCPPGLPAVHSSRSPPRPFVPPPPPVTVPPPAFPPPPAPPKPIAPPSGAFSFRYPYPSPRLKSFAHNVKIKCGKVLGVHPGTPFKKITSLLEAHYRACEKCLTYRTSDEVSEYLTNNKLARARRFDDLRADERVKDIGPFSMKCAGCDSVFDLDECEYWVPRWKNHLQQCQELKKRKKDKDGVIEKKTLSLSPVVAQEPEIDMLEVFRELQRYERFRKLCNDPMIAPGSVFPSSIRCAKCGQKQTLQRGHYEHRAWTQHRNKCASRWSEQPMQF